MTKESTLYIELSPEQKDSPMAGALSNISFGTKRVESLVDGETEADIALTDSPSTALSMMKNTENTIIGIVFMPKQEQAAVNFAANYPQRIRVLPALAIMAPLLHLIAERRGHENPSH